MNYSTDVVSQLESILTDELKKSINAQIMKDLFNKQNIRKAKIDIVKDKIKSSE